jgi:Domain of unknown function (DUF4249)
MKNFLFIIAFAATIAILAACNASSFETIVPYEVPFEKTRLVINAELSGTKDTFIAYLSKSRTTSEAITEAFDTLSKANVSLYKDGVKYRDLTFVKKENALDNNVNDQYLYKYMAIVDKNLPLTKYTLKASAVGYDDILADDVLSEGVNINNLRFQIDGFESFTTSLNGKTKTIQDLVEFDINDPAANNFYIIQISYKQTNNQGDSILRLSNFTMNQQFTASNTGYSGNKALIPDLTFAGKNLKIQIGVTPPRSGGKGGGPNGGGGQTPNRPKYYDIIVKSVSRNTYQFENSLAAYNANNGNPFAEPTVLYTNVYKGYGLFSAVNVMKKRIYL